MSETDTAASAATTIHPHIQGNPGHPPLYIITPFSKQLPREYLRRLYASMQFHLVKQWIIVHDDTQEEFAPVLEYEARVLRLLLGHDKILELPHSQAGSVTGHAQRNRGLEHVPEHGLVYMADGDTIVHPNLWHLLVNNFTLGNFYTFDSFYKPPADVLPGNHVAVNQIDTGMFVVDRRLIGNLTWIIDAYNADGEFASAVLREHPERHVYMPIIAAFYNFSKQNFTSLAPQASRRLMRLKHGSQ